MLIGSGVVVLGILLLIAGVHLLHRLGPKPSQDDVKLASLREGSDAGSDGDDSGDGGDGGQ